MRGEVTSGHSAKSAVVSLEDIVVGLLGLEALAAPNLLRNVRQDVDEPVFTETDHDDLRVMKAMKQAHCMGEGRRRVRGADHHDVIVVAPNVLEESPLRLVHDLGSGGQIRSNLLEHNFARAIDLDLQIESQWPKLWIDTRFEVILHHEHEASEDI